MSQPTQEEYKKKELMALIKEEGNSKCNDCGAPNPQWCSLGFGTFICLECSGVHRSMGTHLTFVRSATMDKWSDDQLRKMKLGGNIRFQQFVSSYGPTGGYKPNMKILDKHASWAAVQYKEKLTALCTVPPTEWSPSAPPPPSAAPASANSSRPSSAQGVRKPRGFGNTNNGSSLSREAESGGFEDDEATRRKAANESFFDGLGRANESRRDDLPPSQGGKYAGFGSTPEPSSSQSSAHPSFALSSHNAPSFDDLRTDPLRAASKGWGLFSAAVSAASRTVQQTIVDPTLQHLSDPALQQNLRSGLGNVAQSAQKFGEQANGFVKERAGVDLVGKFGELSTGGGGAGHRGGGGGGYSQASLGEGEDEDERPRYGGQVSEGGWGGQPSKRRDSEEPDDFAAIFGDKPTLHAKKAAPAAKKKDDEWDDW